MDHGVGIGPTWFAFKARLGYQQPAREKMVGKVGVEPTSADFRGRCPAIRRLSKNWRTRMESNHLFGFWRPIVSVNTGSFSGGKWTARLPTLSGSFCFQNSGSTPATSLSMVAES